MSLTLLEADHACQVVSERAVMTSLLSHRESIKNKTALDDMRNGQQFHLPVTQ